jgi:hypothetical protein
VAAAAHTSRGFWQLPNPMVAVITDSGGVAFVGAARAAAQGLVHSGVGDGRGPGGGAVAVDSSGAAAVVPAVAARARAMTIELRRRVFSFSAR